MTCKLKRSSGPAVDIKVLTELSREAQSLKKAIKNTDKVLSYHCVDLTPAAAVSQAYFSEDVTTVT